MRWLSTGGSTELGILASCGGRLARRSRETAEAWLSASNDSEAEAEAEAGVEAETFKK